MPRSGPDVALLLLAGFRTLVDAASSELAELGYEDVRPVHDFALRAILGGADTASELGRRTAVTKQAAAKTIAALEERGYVSREADPADRRRTRVLVTDRGRSMLTDGARIMDGLRDRWEEQVGPVALAAVEDALDALVGLDTVRPSSPGWVATDPSV
ncbi:MarR family winged helix-turn-helix transcriptional regulator [Aeromicrobium chenweiae]|uniref:MarR family transcriptional regulator n=1 Tax=Aeromicrobium chenweiae TaxID=2079793 RepID=A0A2S0WLT0_9ACTN|nr:MarR family transcriptional regulator [Aeromicrobium chenweiae]AWB92299.1 MarR family transcriptional regulator [Aeromicrobium chenweiae]TGN31417.1 MarR family transcriptional regulator [Aeromicrobium chenweiae]